MHCTNCGTTLTGEAKFCPSCGTPASTTENIGPSDSKHESLKLSKGNSKNNAVAAAVILVVSVGFVWWLNSGGARDVGLPNVSLPNVSSGLDAEFFYCEVEIAYSIPEIKDCKWHDLMDNYASCTLTNTGEYPFSLGLIDVWSYSDAGVLLERGDIVSDSVAPGRSVKIEFMFDMETDKGYLCPGDPESDAGKAAVAGKLRRLAIN